MYVLYGLLSWIMVLLLGRVAKLKNRVFMRCRVRMNDITVFQTGPD